MLYAKQCSIVEWVKTLGHNYAYVACMNIHRIIYLISNNFAIQGKNLNFHSNAMKHFFYEEQGNINENSETLLSPEM